MGHLRALVLLIALLGAASPAFAFERVVAFLGDSLTAGLGVAPEEAYPALLEARIKREGYPYRALNAGVSGDTSAGGLRRVDWVLKLRPAVVVVALGANDGLRGQPVDALRDNLMRIVERAKAADARVLLAGMRPPPNYGDEYARAFAAAYADVAKATGVPLAPFLLDGVAGDPRLNQPDGIHPTVEGQRIIAERLWPHLKPLLFK
ncbi:MAG TPA: arylesterase [Methylomirabilota bacterium]|jgi:acyl-CoA thioesterase-1|nr:arylesterase [Methylomirabilota bacterium]